MRFVCTQENLLESLEQVTPLAGRNKQLPILQYLLGETKEGVLHLTCTDLEIGVHTTVLGKVEEGGRVAIPARKVLEYVQQLPPTHPLYLTTNDNRLKITTAGFEAYFPTTEADDFPLLPSLAEENPITLPASPFCQALADTVFAASREATRPELHSIFIAGEGNEVRLAATDSFRLAEEIIGVDEAIEPFSFLLPLSIAQEIIRLFRQRDRLRLLPHQTHLSVHDSTLEVSSRLIEGAYPDYRHIIPTTFQLEGEVETEELRRALKTVAIFLSRDSRRVLFQFNPSSSELTVKVGGGDIGEGTVTIACQGTGAPLEVLFNIHYVLEGLQHLTTPRCRLRLKGPQEPAVIGEVGTDRKSVYVVMPIQA